MPDSDVLFQRTVVDAGVIANTHVGGHISGELEVEESSAAAKLGTPDTKRVTKDIANTALSKVLRTCLILCPCSVIALV